MKPRGYIVRLSNYSLYVEIFMARHPTQIDELMSLFFAMGRVVRQNARDTKPSAHLSVLQLETLRYIAEHDRPLMKDIAAFLAVTPPSATSLVEGLVSGGQLKRSPDPTDRRSIRIEITPKGKTAIEKLYAAKRASIQKVFSRLSAKEQETLITILKKVTNSHEK